METTSDGSELGIVYLVGAGPGDPSLLTLRGAELLKRADVVLYDYLVNPIIARHAQPGADLICLGKHGRTRIWSQDEINGRLLELANEGKTVVRLKSGDPSIFARAGEEVAYLKQHHIPFEVVPGITAAMALGSYAGVSLTHRDHASAVAFVTGRESSKRESSLDYEALAAFPGTIVIYMGVTTAKQWSSKLIQHGMASTTPVALVRRCSHTDQRTMQCQLDTVADCLTPYSKFPPPVLIVIGEAARDAGIETWFERRPLFGQSVLVTRPACRAMEMSRQLEEAGAQVMIQPAIEILPTSDLSHVGDVCRRLGDFPWITFTSVNGVDYFFRRLMEFGMDSRALAGCQIAVVGPATGAALAAFGIKADLVPTEYRAECLANELLPLLGQGTCLVIRGERSSGVLESRLAEESASYESLIVYDVSDVTTPSPEIGMAMQAGNVDWTLVTSPAIARSIVQQFGQDLAQTKLVSISSQTSEALRAAGFQVAIESGQAESQAMIAALIRQAAPVGD
jgi:uroporphyrinogen III methyltransferase/synthase